MKEKSSKSDISAGKNNLLNDRQQLLLMAFYDGESGVIARWQARRLLMQTPVAGEFLDRLDRLSHGIESSLADGAPELESSLWKSVALRIDQEERAALYLGDRPGVARKGQRSSWLAPLVAPMGWSVAGGVVAATFTFLFLGNLPHSGLNQQDLQNDRLAGRQLSAPVNLLSPGNDLPKLIEPDNQRSKEGRSYVRGGVQPSVDVDWVRSDGAVRFFSDPVQHSTMIWVKKRAPVVRFYNAPTPPVKILSPRTESVYSEMPRLLEQRIPQSVSVGNR